MTATTDTITAATDTITTTREDTIMSATPTTTTDSLHSVLASMTIASLRSEARACGLTIARGMRKSDIVDMLVAHASDTMAIVHVPTVAIAPTTPDTDTTTDTDTMPDMPIMPTTTPTPDYIGGLCYGRLTASQLRTIQTAIYETGAHLLTDGMVARGHGDYAIGVYCGRYLVYALPLSAHGTRISPASIYGAPHEAPSWYVEASDSDRQAHRTYNFRASDGRIYSVKATTAGAPIGRKLTMRKYVQWVGEWVSHELYSLMHMSDVDWMRARGEKWRVRLVTDTEFVAS